MTMSRDRPTEAKGGGYHRLLNSVIEEILGQSESDFDPLPASQIGATHWSSTEKESFFSKLALCGAGDLRALSQTIGSKSEAEVHLYISLLEKGAIEASHTDQYRCNLADIPAAFEVGGQCEAALERAAEKLARKVADREAQAEREKHGDDWLIDEAFADRLQQHAERSEGTTDNDGNEDPTIGATGQQDTAPFASAGLLRPATFLQLSRSLFMNSPSSGDTWHDLTTREDSNSTGPAIFRTALDDFYNLAVSLTRRLVQASLFQTTSRLRASDSARTSWSPKPEVKEVDVKAVLHVLGMDAERTGYWAQLPIRCGLDVYSDSKRYRDGRPGTKNGVKLTLEETETELGLRYACEIITEAQDSKTESHDARIDDLDLDSDMFTIVSASDGDSSTSGKPNESIAASENSYAEEDSKRIADRASDFDPASETESVKDEQRFDDDVGRARKRKRSLSPASYIRAEKQYLEASDQEASRLEERHLWESLKQKPPEKKVADRLGLAPAPTPRYDSIDRVHVWRGRFKPEAEWEHFPDGITSHEFAEMEEQSRGRRKLRALRQDQMRDEVSAPTKGLSSDEGPRFGQEEEEFGHTDSDSGL